MIRLMACILDSIPIIPFVAIQIVMSAVFPTLTFQVVSDYEPAGMAYSD